MAYRSPGLVSHHLIVGGAGAVGVTYAYFLHKSGEKISILVRDRHKNTFHKNQQGQDCLTFSNLSSYLYLSLGVWVGLVSIFGIFVFVFCSRWIFALFLASTILFGSPIHLLLRHFFPKVQSTRIPLVEAVFDFESVSALEQREPIQFIWLALASNQLREYPLDKLAELCPDALIVNLTPSITDYPYLAEKYPNLVRRMTQATIPIISYQTPLKNSMVPDCCAVNPLDKTANMRGIAGLLPPGETMYIGLAKESPDTVNNIRKLAMVCTRGGLATEIYTESPNAIEHMASLSALFPAFVLSLESAGWKLSALSDNVRALAMAKTCVEICTADKASRGDRSKLLLGPTISKWLIKIIAHVASVHGFQLMPMDLEVYLKYHFTKVGVQMMEHLDEYIEFAKEAGTDHLAMDELKQEVIKCRSKSQ